MHSYYCFLLLDSAVLHTSCKAHWEAKVQRTLNVFATHSRASAFWHHPIKRWSSCVPRGRPCPFHLFFPREFHSPVLTIMYPYGPYISYITNRDHPHAPNFVLSSWGASPVLYLYRWQCSASTNKDSRMIFHPSSPGWDAEVDSWQTNLSHAACPWGGRLVKVILSDVEVRDAPEKKSYMLVPCMNHLECLSWTTIIRTLILEPREYRGPFPSIGQLFCRNIRGVRALPAPRCLNTP